MLPKNTEQRVCLHHLVQTFFGENGLERRTFIFFRYDIEISAVLHQHMFNDGQPKTRSACGTAAGAVDTIKTFGQTRQVFGIYTNAVVLYGKVAVLAIVVPTNSNNSALGRVLDGIGDQITKGAAISISEPIRSQWLSISRFRVCP